MSTPISLKNISLTLYAFHLFKDAETDHLQNADQLWKKIANLSQYFEMPDLKEFPHKILDKSHIDSPFLNLLPCIYEEYFTKKLRSRVIPLKLHDTYAVDFTVGFSQDFEIKNDIKINELSQLNPQDCLLPQNIDASIGQTLLFYAEVENNVEINENLVKECLKNLWKTDCPNFIIRQGQLFGSPFFECEEITNNIPAHILIWFGNHPQTLNLADKSNNYLIKLLCQRHKIMRLGSFAQQDYKLAREYYRQLEEIAKQFNQSLTKEQLTSFLRETLIKLPKISAAFTEHLRNLNDHKTTISTNRENYATSLNNLRELLLPEDKIDWLEFFYKEKSVLLEKQINTNLAYLTPAQSLFQQIINNTQGLAQIETLKHEFDKQERIEFLVVFIATTLESAAISAKVDFHHHLPELLKGLIGNISSELGQHFLNIFTHLGVGLSFGMFALLVLFIARHLHHKKSN